VRSEQPVGLFMVLFNNWGMRSASEAAIFREFSGPKN